MIDAAAIRDRKGELLRAKGQLVANLNATDGAIQECDFWLAELQIQEEDASSEGASEAKGS